MASSPSAPCCSSVLSTRCACRAARRAGGRARSGSAPGLHTRPGAPQAGAVPSPTRPMRPGPAATRLLRVLRLVQVRLEHRLHHAVLAQPGQQRLPAWVATAWMGGRAGSGGRAGRERARVPPAVGARAARGRRACEEAAASPRAVLAADGLRHSARPPARQPAAAHTTHCGRVPASPTSIPVCSTPPNPQALLPAHLHAPRQRLRLVEGVAHQLRQQAHARQLACEGGRAQQAQHVLALQRPYLRRGEHAVRAGSSSWLFETSGARSEWRAGNGSGIAGRRFLQPLQLEHPTSSHEQGRRRHGAHLLLRLLWAGRRREDLPQVLQRLRAAGGGSRRRGRLRSAPRRRPAAAHAVHAHAFCRTEGAPSSEATAKPKR